ncbi:MAG TPA: cyclase family protein [Terriglobales bacterium]|nr:cyclase family protein [Terriglobales bacterium]
MRLKTFTIACACALTLFLFAQHRASPAPQQLFAGVLDLTHLVNEKAPNWEGTAESPFQTKQVASFDKEGYFARYVSLPEHFGTHIDAPAHFAPGVWTVDQIPPQRLVAPLVVIDVRGKVANNPDYQVSLDDLAVWEHDNGAVPPGAVVMALTGWAARWDSMKDYRNADNRGMMHFPGFALETAKFLVQARKIAGLGIDTLSVDSGAAKDFPVHHFTARNNVYHLENVANLERAPEAGAIVVVAPAKLEGGSGGPVRILALLKQGQ